MEQQAPPSAFAICLEYCKKIYPDLSEPALKEEASQMLTKMNQASEFDIQKAKEDERKRIDREAQMRAEHARAKEW